MRAFGAEPTQLVSGISGPMRSRVASHNHNILLASSVRRHHPPRQKLEFKASLIIRHYIDFIHYLHTFPHIYAYQSPGLSRKIYCTSLVESLLGRQLLLLFSLSHTSGSDQVLPGRDTEEILLQ
ncbi:hypothetical protein I312_101664 [Cryptococcus bacillisporus CA1280]|uniref:uncharacterized protein n=1 Tax=Cryptococcus bacillisporus CA1280 TaxID=1296109 RepID=UPI003366E626